MKELKLALIGFGSAGQAFAKMLLEKNSEILDRYSCNIIVTAISTKSKGTIVDNKGIDLNKACTDIKNLNRFSENTTGLCNMTSFQVIENADCDAICELTPLQIFTGQPAIDHIKIALNMGKHVITANKGPIAWAFNELYKLSMEKHCMFFYETTVMDGTPIFNLKENTLKLCRVTEVSGILNSTTNYVLEELEKGKDYKEIIESGKSLGFIEADPSMDIEGFDAAAKVTALLNVLMDAKMTPDMVDRTGIENITLEDIQSASKRNKVIKLICRGTLVDGKINASVKPVEVCRNELPATIDSTSSLITITTDLMGKISIIEHAPEIQQTAYGIFGDVLRVVEGM